MKDTELLLAKYNETTVALVAAIAAHKSLETTLTEHIKILQNRLGFGTLDPVAQRAWTAAICHTPPEIVITALHQLEIRGATLSDFFRLACVVQSGDVNVILQALETWRQTRTNSNN